MMAPRWDKRLRLPKSEGGATICEKHEFIEAHFRDPEMSWEVDQAVTQAKDDGKRMEARLQELGEEANNLEDALSETEADRDRLAAELQAVRDDLAAAHEEILLSRQSEGETMADLLRTRAELARVRRDHLRRMAQRAEDLADRMAWSQRRAMQYARFAERCRAALANNAKDAA
jgi:chromosome segregation ATPase